MWLNRKSPNSFKALVDRAIEGQKNPYLVFTVRSDVTIRSKYADGFRNSIETLLTHPANSRFAFCTPAKAVEMMTDAKSSKREDS
jgi:hypothetical protein